MRLLYILLACLLSPVARADDIEDLLNRIPTIETKEPARTEEAAPQEEVSLPDYIKQCREHLAKHLVVPGSVAKKAPGTKAKVMLKLDENGAITGVQAVQMSGEKKFDKAVLKAISAADPLPAPPITLREDAARGVVVELTARP